jgi:hypothetical protein
MTQTGIFIIYSTLKLSTLTILYKHHHSRDMLLYNHHMGQICLQIISGLIRSKRSKGSLSDLREESKTYSGVVGS